MGFDENLLKKLGFNADDNVTMADIEARYEDYLRFYMSKARSGQVTQSDESLMDELSEAYNTLTGKKKQNFDNKWYQGFNMTSFRNFVYLFKLQIFAVVFLIIAASVTIYQLSTREVYDFRILTAGSISYSETKIEQDVEKIVQGVKNVNVKSYNDLGQEGFLAIYISAELEIFLVDKQDFETFAKQGYCMPLDDLAKKYKIDFSKQADNITTNTIDTQHQKLYGLSIGKSKLLSDSITSKNVVVAIANNTKNKDKAVAFMSALMKEVAKKQ